MHDRPEPTATDEASFLRLFMRSVGQTKVPPDFYLWSALSAIASCVGDRVGYRKHADTPLAPNLYVMLVGPSGCGKGTAIGAAVRLAGWLHQARAYAGNITKQALIDELSWVPSDDEDDPPKPPVSRNLWLVSTELADDVPPGPIGEELIRFMTKVYEGTLPLPVQERTRKHGRRSIPRPCLNWLAGTTREWMAMSLPKSAAEGGASARIVIVERGYTGLRCPHPAYPDDRPDLLVRLREMVSRWGDLSGEFSLTKAAREHYDRWYLTRQEPQDDRLRAAWERQDDLLLKLSMLLSLNQSTDLVIRTSHLVGAERLIRTTAGGQIAAIEAASVTPKNEGFHHVTKLLRRRRVITHSAALKLAGNHGILREEFAECVETLIQSHQLTVGVGPKGGRVYLWRVPRGLAAVPDDEETP